MSPLHGPQPTTKPGGLTPRSTRRSGLGPGDVFVGVVFGVLAGSNLVQGSWSQELPWLNLTAASFALALPATLVALRHHVAMRSTAAILILAIALTLGYLHPALNAAAHGKRLSLIVTVLLLSIASMVCLTNDRRLRAFFVTVVVMAAVVLLGQLLAPDPAFLATGRRTPRGLNSIGAGRVLGAGLIITFASTLKRSVLIRTALLLFVCLPFGFGIVLAGSRGPLLGVLVALVFLLLVRPSVSATRKVMVLASGVPALYLAQSLVVAMGSRIGAATGSSRGVLYDQGFQLAREYPLGIGWGNFFRYAPATLRNSGQPETLYVHNVILEFWVEAGAIAGILFILFCMIVFATALRHTQSPAALTLGALAVSLFVGALLSSDIVGDRMMWASFGAILGGHTARSIRNLEPSSPTSTPSSVGAAS